MSPSLLKSLTMSLIALSGISYLSSLMLWITKIGNWSSRSFLTSMMAYSMSSLSLAWSLDMSRMRIPAWAFLIAVVFNL